MVALTEALKRARSVLTPTEDWVILRLDQDDRTLEIYWSEPNAPYYRTSLSANTGGTQPDGTVLTRGWGGHAEMNMIRDFEAVLAAYQARPGKAGAYPDMVEIFISRSPCSRSPVFTANGVNYPIGCGAKLRTFIQHYHQVLQWRVIFDEVFKGSRTGVVHDHQAIMDAHAGIADLNRLPNVEARKFNMFIDV